MLISPGSSLGGARPKANVRDKEGNLWIAKFPSNNDELDIGAWEMVVHELAASSGINAVSTGTGLTLNISENDNSLSLELALEVAQHFRIKPKEASAMIDDMKKSISHWRQIASQYKLSSRELDAMSEAFYAE